MQEGTPPLRDILRGAECQVALRVNFAIIEPSVRGNRECENIVYVSRSFE